MKTYCFKLYKTKKLKYLNSQINIAGYIYNYCINLHKRYYKLYGKFLNVYQLQKHITKKKKYFKYWNNLNSQAIQDITDRINKAYKLFFRNLKHKIKTTPPSFKKRNKYKSITLKQCGFKLLKGNKIKIQNKVFKYSNSRDIVGNIKTLTIKRDNLGDFYIYIVTDFIDSKPTTTGNIVGCDFGLKTFLTLSDTTKIKSSLFYKQSQKILKKACQNLSSKKKGSNNRKKAKLNLSRKYNKITNQRRDHHFKLAKKLCEKYDYLFFEDLNLKGMQKLWGRKINDLGFYSFLKILESQGKKYSCEINYIDRFFPSSKLCHSCGIIKKDLTLKDRVFKCDCGHDNDRDLNASLNILREGASSLGVEILRPESSG